MNIDAFEERAAIMEFDGGMTRFQAETEAAAAQGVQRWEAIGDAARRVVSKARDQRSAMAERRRAVSMPRVQSHEAQEG